MNLETFYSNVEAERARRGWTISQISEKLNISEKTYRNRLANGKDLPASAVYSLATLFDVSADYLLGLSDKIGRV